MLNKLRVFSKGKLATVLVAIIIIPFVFWGMGGVFSSGNTNSLAKIDNINISTQEFIEHINNLNINQEAIRENLDNEIVEVFKTTNKYGFEVTILSIDKNYYKFQWVVEKFYDEGPLKDCWLTISVSNPISLGSST